MGAGRRRLLQERQHEVLHERGGAVEDAGVVRRHHHEHHQHEAEREQHGREEAPERHGEHHLVVHRAEVLELLVRRALAAELPGVLEDRVADLRLVGGVEVVVARERRVDADAVDGRRDRLDALRDGRRERGAVLAGDLVGHAGGELLARLVRLVRVVRVVHHRDHREDEHRDHDGREAAAPVAEDAGHLLLVRRLAHAAVVVADPRVAAEEAPDDRRDEREHVEVAQGHQVVGVQEALARDAVRRDGHHLARPRELDEDEHDEDDEDRVGDDALDRVGDDERDAAAGEDDDERHRDADREEERVGRDRHPEQVRAVRDAQQVDEEARRDRRADAVGEHLAEDADARREDAEAAAVAHLQVLAARHRARPPEADRHVAEEPEEEPERHQDVVPEAHRPAGLVVRLGAAHEVEDGESVHHAGGAQHVAAGDAARDEVVGDALGVAVRVDRHVEDVGDRDDDDDPVVPVQHGGGVQFVVGRALRAGRSGGRAGGRLSPRRLGRCGRGAARGRPRRRRSPRGDSL